MKAYAFAVLGVLACNPPTPNPAGPATCSDRLHEIRAEGWHPERAPIEDASEFAFTKPSEGKTYYRALHCEAGLVRSDAEWAIFDTQEEARHHYDGRLAEVIGGCSTEIVEPSALPEQPRTPTPISSTTYFSYSVSYIAIAGCLEPDEKRILSLARLDSHSATSEPETEWSVEYNRQPAP